MSKTQKTIWWTLGIVVVVCIVAWGISKNSGSNSGAHQIKIGVILPETGDFSVTGEKMYNGVLLAAAELPSNVQLVYEDDHSDVTTGVTAATKLLSVDKVDMLIGLYNPDEVQAVAPIAKAAGKKSLPPTFATALYSADECFLRISGCGRSARDRHSAHPKRSPEEIRAC